MITVVIISFYSRHHILDRIKEIGTSVPVIIVENSRKALSRLASNFYEKNCFKLISMKMLFTNIIFKSCILKISKNGHCYKTEIASQY